MERNELLAEKRRGNDSGRFHNDSFDFCSGLSGVFIWSPVVSVQDTDWSDYLSGLLAPAISEERKAAAWSS